MAIPKNWTSITTSTVTHMNKIESQKNFKHWNAQFQCLKLHVCQYLTNHALISDKRIASKFGVGKFNNVYGRNGSYVTAGQQDYAERMNQIQKQKEAYYKQQGIAPGVPTEKGAYGDPENTGVGYNAVLTELGNHDVPQGWVQTPKPNTTPNTNPGPPVSWNDPSTPDDPQTGYGYIPNDTTKEETFFYHSDHLGSTSYITDDRGNITQYDAYLPYGELLVDEHSSSEDLPYKFNGKQFDEETGLYYYGARYMNPVASIWYGVDPLAEKYINIGSYIYCHSSPIILIDPTGEGDYYAKNGSYLGTDKKKDNFIYIQYSSGKTKFEINGKYQNFQKLDVTRNTFLAFASAINNESSGNKQESMALANVVMNFINDGGSKTLKTLDDVVLYRNSFMRGSNQKAVNEFQGLPINSKNRTLAIAAVINALGYNQGLTGFSDYSGGANTWEGKDLMYTNWPNSHRNYIWSSDSKQLLKQYKLLVHGSVNVDGFKYKNTYGENHQIQVNIKATMIAGKTLFTHLYGGRGEKRYEHLNF